MPDFSNRKINLTTPQPGGRKGESPLAAFTKVNNLIDDLSAGKSLALVPWPLANLNSAPTNVAPGEYSITTQTNRPDDKTGTASWNGVSLFFRTDDGLMFMRKRNTSSWSAWSAYRPSGKPDYGHFRLTVDFDLPHAATTYVDFNDSLITNGVYRDDSVSPPVFRINQPGLYAVTGRTFLPWAAPSGFVAVYSVPSASGIPYFAHSFNSPEVQVQYQSVSGIFRCTNANTGFRFGVNQRSGSTKTINGSTSTNNTSLTIARVGELS